MKALQSSFFVSILIGTVLTSCQKDTEKVLENKSSNKLFARTVEVYDEDHSNSATLRFRSSSKELLERIPLENFEFTIVKAPTSVSNNTEDLNKSSAFGKVNFSQSNVSQITKEVGQIQLPDKAIYVDIASETKTPSVSIKVKNKPLKSSKQAIDKPSEESLWVDDGTQRFFITSYGYHRVQIDNLSANALNVDFYYDSCEDGLCTWTSDDKGTINRYSGYSFTLYNGGWAWYYNCDKTVGALVTIAPNTAYSFVWTLWTNCTP